MEETKIEEVLAKLGTDLDGRFSSVRTAETNLGNLMCDVMLAALQADCSLLNAGTVRSNIKHSKGEFKLRVSRLSFRDWQSCYLFPSTTCSGQILLKF